MGRKVMVVENDDATRFMMSEFLDTLGYPHEVVASGPACLDRLDAAAREFGVILMDIHMPDVTGLDTSRRIRALHDSPARTLPIIAVSADASFDALDRVSPHGVTDVMPKPVSLQTLDAKLRSYLP